MLVRGGASVCAGGLLVLLLSALALQYLKFSPGAVLGFRVLVVAALAALVGWFLVRPLARPGER